jgi:hypothetical protein
MGVRSTHEITCLRKAQAHSQRRCGLGADFRLLVEHVPAHPHVPQRRRTGSGQARNVTTGLDKSTLDAMGVQNTLTITCLRKARVNSLRQRGPNAEFVPLAEHEHQISRAQADAQRTTYCTKSVTVSRHPRNVIKEPSKSSQDAARVRRATAGPWRGQLPAPTLTSSRRRYALRARQAAPFRVTNPRT